MAEFVPTTNEPKTYKFVISGGPCAGKTTAMERLPVFLSERGFRVFVVPEAATMLWLNGAAFSDLENPKCAFAFQQFVIRTQMQLEDSFLNFAKSTGQDSIILCDRGVMDGSAYVPRDEWLKLLREVGVDEVNVRDQRYDAVYHLVTAADGAESFYSLANNKGRSESEAAAIEQDRRTQAAWAGHPHHTIIDNRNTFEQKLERLISLISRAVGLPSLARRAWKYLVRMPDLAQLPHAQVFDVEKIILASTFSADSMTQSKGASGDSNRGKVLYSFIRRRTQHKSNSYGLTTVKELDNGEIVELKNVITDKVYDFLKTNAADPTRSVILQKRYYFLWNKQSFQLYEHLFEDVGAVVNAVAGQVDGGAAASGAAASSVSSPSRTAVSTRGLPSKLSSSTSSSLLTALQENLCTLYCQCQGSPELPPFIDVVQEVNTSSDEFSAYNISKLDSLSRKASNNA